ncbi:MAG: hypothetical protein ABFD79_05905 [Phycisphaerales bacterium]
MINKYIHKVAHGSALIMTIVLTVMLAAVAVMFVAVARMDKASTSNIAANKMLDSAAMSIVELINQQLIYDVPGVAKIADVCEVNFPQYFEYKDYPDACDSWLASSEPYYDKTEATKKNRYKWHQISDVTGYLKEKNYPMRNIRVKPVGLGGNYDVVREYPLFGVDVNGVLLDKNGNEALDGVSADADGDGIADSKWIDISNLRTSTGRLFAAIRVIDNGGMANINTAYQFNPNPTDNDPNKIDGSSQMQINLDEAYKGLLKNPDIIKTLHDARRGSPTDPNVEANLIWDFNNFPENGYQQFDSSDELELRYRYCIDSKFTSRFETFLPHTTDSPSGLGQLYNTDTVGKVQWGIDEWFERMTDTFDPNNDRDRRHLLTTYNCDRLIDPNGNDMININDANTTALYNVFRKVYDFNTAAQIAINITNYRDEKSDVNAFTVNINGTNKTFYGFENPCIYISEIAYRKEIVATEEEPNSYAIEFFKPYETDDTPNGNWYLFVYDKDHNMKYRSQLHWTGTNQYHVLRLNKGISIDLASGCSYFDIETVPPPPPPPTSLFENEDEILLVRKLPNGDQIVVDRAIIPAGFKATGIKDIQRDIRKHKCLTNQWSQVLHNKQNLGTANTDFDDENTDPNIIQAHPANREFHTVGDIGMVLKKAPYYNLTDAEPNGIPNMSSGTILEHRVLLNAADPNFQSAFKYLTAMPCSDSNDRVKGRININTAPVSVLAQLPWVATRSSTYKGDPNLAKAIVAYRDKMELVPGEIDYRNRQPDPCGFDNIGQLMNVFNNNPSTYKDYDIRSYALDGADQKGFPDLSTDPTTKKDGAIDDFEERDLIFARISDLVTVRSDVFTAYILVRVGTDGPQKRYVAILDRSEVRKSGDKVKIRAFQLVPDAR